MERLPSLSTFSKEGSGALGAAAQRPQDADSDRIFVSRRRDRRTGGYEPLTESYEPLTESGVQQLVRELGHRAGIAKRVHPHVFRHSAATHMLRRGMNPLLVSKVLGHESQPIRRAERLVFQVDDEVMVALGGLKNPDPDHDRHLGWQVADRARACCQTH